jgi:hypothetical protein
MTFSYDVMTEEEAMQERFKLLKDGDYDAVVDNSIDTVSQTSGKPMMDMNLTVYDSFGRGHTVRDFLVFKPSSMWKIIHCAESAGLIEEYKSNKFCSDIIKDRNVRVRIITEKGGEIPLDKLKGKPEGSRYPDKNRVQDYIVSKREIKVISELKSDFIDDEVPFWMT